MSERTLLKAGNLEVVKDASGKLYSPNEDTLKTWKPLDYIMTWIDKRRNAANTPADRILILQASTGSGKSTIIPPELYHRFWSRDDPRNICCTQPRVITSIDIPNTILEYHTKEALQKQGHPNRMPLKLGDNIGFQTGIISKRPIRGIIFMTIGVLMQQLNIMSDEEIMDRYAFIIIDEVHERSIGTDDVLYSMKRFINRNCRNRLCPFLIAMSATFNVWKFADYLLTNIDKRYENIIKVKGASYTITDIWPKYDATNYIQSIIDTVVHIHEDHYADLTVDKKHRLSEDAKRAAHYRDVLIFVAGASQIRKLKKSLHELNTSRQFFQKYPILPVELTRDVVEARSNEYKSIFEDIENLTVEIYSTNRSGSGDCTCIANGCKCNTTSCICKSCICGGALQLKVPTRRIIISTNVAETGITINTIKYVIDSGWFKSNEFNPNFGTEMLIMKPVVQHMATQRRGRTGRKSPGFYYPMFTHEVYQAMSNEQYPEIIKNEITLNPLNFIIREVDSMNYLTSLPLQEIFSGNTPAKWTEIKSAHLDISKLDLIDLPSIDSLHCSMEKLYVLGALNSFSLPTELGVIINRFRFMTIENIKMLLAGYTWEVSIMDLIDMISVLETGFDMLIPSSLAKAHHEAVAMGCFVLPNLTPDGTSFMLADDFLRGLLVFRSFQQYLADIDIDKSSTLSKMQKWTEKRGLGITGLYQAVELREDIINMLALIGFDPYYKFEQSIYTTDNLSDTLRRLKLCIFEGYKLNILIWNAVDKKYYTRGGHSPTHIGSLSKRGGIVPLNGLLQGPFEIARQGDTNPHYLIYHTLTCSPDEKKELYEMSVDMISVIDGFFPLDANFDTLL
jgi:HrpA-like RNA helicase